MDAFERWRMSWDASFPVETTITGEQRPTSLNDETLGIIVAILVVGEIVDERLKQIQDRLFEIKEQGWRR